jgi:hypothetical protein
MIIWTFRWTYARFSEHTLLFVVWTYVGGPSNVLSANGTWTYTEMLDVHYFLGILSS